MDAAVIRRVLALSEQTVLLDSRAGIGNLLRVLVGDALATFVILFAVLRSPPVAQIALSVELTPLIVKTMREFVTDDHTDGAEINGVIHTLLEERRLQNTGGGVYRGS